MPLNLEEYKYVQHNRSFTDSCIYSRTPEIETADLSQSHAGLNLSQFQTGCILCINSSTAILNYFNQHLAL